jgi:hypothetical protein
MTRGLLAGGVRQAGAWGLRAQPASLATIYIGLLLFRRFNEHTSSPSFPRVDNKFSFALLATAKRPQARNGIKVSPTALHSASTLAHISTRMNAFYNTSPPPITLPSPSTKPTISKMRSLLFSLRTMLILTLLTALTTLISANGLQIDITSPVECTRKTKKGDKVDMHYRGTLASDGSEFDASYNRGAPLSFQLGAGRVIKG